MTAAAICGLALIDSGYLLLTSLQILDRFLKPLASRLDRRPADKPAARIRRARSEQPELEKTPTVRKLRAFEIRGRYVKRQRRWLMNDQGPGIWFAGEAEITRKWLLGAGLVRLRPTTGFLSPSNSLDSFNGFGLYRFVEKACNSGVFYRRQDFRPLLG